MHACWPRILNQDVVCAQAGQCFRDEFACWKSNGCRVLAQLQNPGLCHAQDKLCFEKRSDQLLLQMFRVFWLESCKERPF